MQFLELLFKLGAILSYPLTLLNLVILLGTTLNKIIEMLELLVKTKEFIDSHQSHIDKFFQLVSLFNTISGILNLIVAVITFINNLKSIYDKKQNENELDKEGSLKETEKLESLDNLEFEDDEISLD